MKRDAGEKSGFACSGHPSSRPYAVDEPIETERVCILERGRQERIGHVHEAAGDDVVAMQRGHGCRLRRERMGSDNHDGILEHADPVVVV